MAKRINQKQYTVKGTIIDPFNNPLKGLLVKATDQDPNTPENLLGTPSWTDGKGKYRITYTDADFRIGGRESGGADIIIRVFSPEGELLGKSKRHGNAPQHTTIDMEVDYTPLPEIEFEYTVSGQIHLPDGQPARQFYIHAFDKDLRSEQLLGEAMTNKEGRYSITYSSYSIKRAERGSADLFLRIYDPKNKPVGTSDVFFNAPPRTTIDYVIAADAYDPLSEFEQLHMAVHPLLSGTTITALDESDKHQDIAFLSGETGYSYDQILHFVQAHYYEKDSKIAAPFWYVVLDLPVMEQPAFDDLENQRAQISERLSQLDTNGIRKALNNAFASRAIETKPDKVVDQWIRQFGEYVSDKKLVGPGSFTGKALEEAGIKAKAKKQSFARTFNAHRSFTKAMIKELKKAGFKESEIEDLQTSYDLSRFVQGNFDMVQSIRKKFEVRKPADIPLLARRAEKEWIALVKTSDTNKTMINSGDLTLPNEHQAPFAEVYGQSLYNQFRTAYPTMAFSGGLERVINKKNSNGVKDSKKILKIIKQNPDFEILTTPIDEFARKNPILKKDKALKQELKAIQRIFKLVPDFEATNTLMKDNQHAALGIYRMGESEFVRMYKDKPGFTAQKAREAWRKAEATHAAATSLVAELKATENAGSIAAFKFGNDVVSDFPNWNNLFKGGDLCECKHCRSVYSPAAYFADLLMYLKDRKPKGIPVTKTMFDRRPDLGYLELNCENAHVTLPYIDVVNEVLETIVADGEFDQELTGFTTINSADLDQAKTDVINALQAENLTIGGNIHLARIGSTNRWVIHSDTITYLLKKKGGANYFAEILRNTKATSGELRAYPQYVNPAAYQKLSAGKFPFELPFDLFGEEVEASFNKVKIHRWELMQLYKGNAAPNNATDGEVAAVYFGISVPAEKDIILKAAPASQFELWGESSNATLLGKIKNVKTFLRVTGLEYNQLLTLLDLEFINPGGNIRIDHLDPTCDTDQKEIKPLDVAALDRINRFLRLWRKLGWKMWEVDLVIRQAHIGNGGLNETFLVNLMYVVELKNKLGKKVNIEQVCGLFGNINVGTRFTELHGKRADVLYQELFLNRKLINPLDEAFEVSKVDAAVSAEKIAAHKSAVQAALRLKETDLDIFLNLTKASDGSPYIPNGVNGDLILTNLSFLYRHAFLAQTLKIKARDWQLLLKILNTDFQVFTDAKEAWKLIEDIQLIQSSEYSPDELNYLLTSDRTAKAVVRESEVGRFLLSLRTNLQAVVSEFNPDQYEFLQEVPPTDKENLEGLLTRLLQRLGKDEGSINYIRNLLENTATTETTVPGLPAGFDFPGPVSNTIRIRYSDSTKMMRFTGLMTDAERTTLLTDGSLAAVTGIASYQEAIKELYLQPRLALKFYEPQFTATLSNLPAAISFKSQLSGDLTNKISYNAQEKQVEFTGIMTRAEKESLETLSADPAYLNAINSLFTQPTTGVFDSGELWILPADLDFTVQEFYNIHLALAITRLLQYFEEKNTKSTIVRQISDQLDVSENMVEKITNEYTIIGAENVLDHFRNSFGPTTGVLDYGTAKDSFDTYYWLHRVSLFISKWDLDFDELEWLITYHGPTQTMDFATLPIDHLGSPVSLKRFLRTEKLVKLNSAYRDEEISLLTIISRLQEGEYAALSDFVTELEILTDWSMTDTEVWINNTNLTYPGDYLLAENWMRLYKSMKIVEKLNAGVTTVHTLTAASVGQSDVETIKQILRSKYGPDTWLKICTEIQDVLRERKRDALSAYILSQPRPADAPSGKWEHTNDLYAYYLLDTEMSSCMLTSRLVQGSGSIQLFVQRCFMGLEPEVPVRSDGDDGDSAWRWWKWMRKYRVWEANRKVFLYPENWIEPELRPDKSSFFQELENELLQNEVNQLNVEKAYLNYLDRLNEVTRLDIAGFYHEDDADQTIMHVFGRTAHADPHIYYYRQYDYRRWTPWKKVEVDIVGDHLIPMVINKRLYIFWPEFREVPDDDKNNSVDIPNQGDNNTTLPPTYKRTQLRLAGSEFRNGKWTPKKISKDYFESYYYTGHFNTGSITFFPVDRSETDGRAGIKFKGTMYGSFELFGCEGVPVKSNLPGNFHHTVSPDQSHVRYLDYREDLNRQDYPDDDFSLWSQHFYSGAFNDYITNPVNLLEKTPGKFLSYFAWHLSYFDKLFQGSPLFTGILQERGLPVGSWLPFFYADHRKTFVAFPMLGCSEHREPVVENVLAATYHPGLQCTDIMKFVGNFLGGDENSKYYYPAIKEGFREIQRTIEGYIRAAIGAVDLSGFTQAQKIAIANQYGALMGEEAFKTITDDELIELVIRFFMRIFNFYLGIYSSLLFNFRRYHFKNFYHPFVCDFIKIVYNPIQGIPVMMSRETQLKDSGFRFERRYDPTAWVFDHPVGEEYPKEVVDFSPDGSYSPYNWELFYHTPLMIANSLSQNQRFEEAMEWYHFIFNPIGLEGKLPDGTNAKSPQKYWITKPFFLTTNKDYYKQRIDTILRMIAGDTSTQNYSSELKSELEAQVRDWRYHPFEPHRIAQYRNVAYQKTVFMKYLDNLIAWGDQLFRQDSMESINEATQLYVLAAELLGPRPKNIPPQVVPPIETFHELEEDFDDFSNALVQVENYIPVMPGDGSSGGLAAPIPVLYFCIPQNNKILTYWDTIADRLFKIRNCMNIEGVVRQLSLFEPEIDPGALVRAVAGGMDISSALADLNAPLPFYRFNVLLQKANEVCGDVRALGNGLLSALEKKDSEELALLRQGHELKLLDAMKAVRELQIEEAEKNLDGLKESIELTKIKMDYYDSREFMNPGEIVATVLNGVSLGMHTAGAVVETLAGVMSLVPDVTVGASGFGGSPHAVVEPPTGTKISDSLSLASRVLYNGSTILDKSAALSNTIASYQRRQEEWDFQKDMAEQELVQLEEQVKAMEIRIKIAEKELANQEQQIENSKEVEDFMNSKYTSKELYQWMVGQISQVYFRSYQLAYDLAKKAERCYRFELGISDSDFIKFGYWDSLKKGLLSGDKLQYDLRRLESAYMDDNRRELELTKHISLALLDPLALIKLRETGKCFFNFPEEIFDLDYPGHYFRRIKSVSISMPCVAGPYTTISCSLRQLNNHIRTETGVTDGYAHNNEDGVWVNDSRFVQNNIPVKAIATSSAQNDSGVFELNFRDERYLPFEGGGVISDWTIDLFNDPENTDFGTALRQFDYNTISDAIIHIRYTARDAGGLLKKEALSNLREYYGADDRSPGLKFINLKHDFPSDWHKMLHPDDAAQGNVMNMKITRNLFPYRDHLHGLKVNRITILARCADSGDYEVSFHPPLPEPPPTGVDLMTLTPVAEFGNLHYASRDTSGESIGLDFSAENTWQLRVESPSGNNLDAKELEDMYVVLGYEWEE